MCCTSHYAQTGNSISVRISLQEQLKMATMKEPLKKGIFKLRDFVLINERGNEDKLGTP